MIASMTGFGRGTAEYQGLQVCIEVRSVNSRFFDLQVRAANGLQEYEAVVRERLQSRLSRGKVSVQLDWEEGTGGVELPVLDEAVARRYARELARLRPIAGLSQDPDWAAWVRLPGLFSHEQSQVRAEVVQSLVLKAVDQAMADFVDMREREGRALERDLRDRVEVIEAHLERIRELAVSDREQVRDRLQEKVQALLQPGQIDENRLATEVVVLAERSDITEEVVRFHSHNTQFLEALDAGGEVGRRLNFLLQEMHREANTITSKTAAAEVSHLAVSVKEEVEKLREQVQNLA